MCVGEGVGEQLLKPFDFLCADHHCFLGFLGLSLFVLLEENLLCVSIPP